jgi:3-hydroxyacyl-CoA dehydrogenase/enoyl-CoA hydratase/3-hydroxybutyryl-CoA epimerase
MFGWDRDDSGVVVITMDDPDQSANTMNDRFLRELPLLVEHLTEARDTITGVIITSAKSTFCAGGDLDKLMRATPADAPQAFQAACDFHAATRALETLGRPVVAALNGTALGGGYELALACHYRIALDAPKLRVGLPEITFGLLPGGGGTARASRLLGILPALQDVLLTGRAFPPRAALDKGMLDEVVDEASALIPAAKTWIAAHPEARQPWDVPGFAFPGGGPQSPAVAAALPGLPASLRKQNQGPLGLGTRNLLAATLEGAQVDIDNALTIEARYFTELQCSQESKNLIQSRFFDQQAINRGANRPQGYPAYSAAKLVVLGAGMMGAGIAYAGARAGIEVVLKDVSDEAAARGKDYSAKLLAKAVERGRMSPDERDAVLARITPTTDAAAAGGADFVIEAVFEDPDLKKRVIAEVVPYLAADAVIASNTSTLPITGLAEGLAAPQNFIGTHFFSPVDKMVLLEIVVGADTSDATLARTVDVARQIGKTPIVVNDSRGFFTSRVIATFLDEAVAMVGEGVPAATIEQAATQAGYPVGPLALMDEVSLTLARAIRQETLRARLDSGLPAQPHPGAAVIDTMIDTFGRGGRAHGAGFYDYDQGRRAGLWPGLGDAFAVRPGPHDLTELQERMLFAEAIDAARCVEEGVLRSVADGNVGSLLGIGFPGWTGGVLQYIDQYPGGVGGFVTRARELADSYGERFTPPPCLVERAQAPAA